MLNGSGSLNSRAINSSSAGSGIVVFTVTEEFFVSDSIAVNNVETVEETAVASDSAIFELAVLETAVLDDLAAEFRILANALETAQMSDALELSRTGVFLAGESAALSDSHLISVFAVENAQESAVLDDSVEQTANGTDIAEIADIGDSVTIALNRVVDSLESATLSDEVLTGLPQTVTETAVLNDSASTAQLTNHTVSEFAVLGDAVSFSTSGRRLDVQEAASLNDLLSDLLVAREDLADEAYFDTEFVAVGGSAGGVESFDLDGVWTANINTWAMSRHTGVGATSRDSRYGVSPDGLYEVDPASYSNSSITTGDTDFGFKNLKRATYMYIHGQHDGDITVSVLADCRGARRKETYTPMARQHTDARALRVSFGRGYNSNRYKFTLNTVGSAELYECEVLIEASQDSRRI